MSENPQPTKQHLEDIYDDVRQYMPAVAKRLAFNYIILIGITAIISVIVMALLPDLIHPSTRRTLALAVSLIWLINGWRYLENRNKATELYTMYTRFSRARRDLEYALKDKAKTEEVSPLVDDAEVTATAFIDAAEEANIEAQQEQS